MRIGIVHNEKENLTAVDLDNATIDNSGLHGIKLHLKWATAQDEHDDDPVEMACILDLEGCSLKRALGRLASGFVIQRQGQERKVGKGAVRKWYGKEIPYSQFTLAIEDPAAVAERTKEAVANASEDDQLKLYEMLKARFAKREIVTVPEEEDEEDSE